MKKIAIICSVLFLSMITSVLAFTPPHPTEIQTMTFKLGDISFTVKADSQIQITQYGNNVLIEFGSRKAVVKLANALFNGLFEQMTKPIPFI